MKRWLLAVLVLLIPPAILLAKRGVIQIAIAALSVVALLICFLLWAGVGALAWLALGLIGAVLTLLTAPPQVAAI